MVEFIGRAAKELLGVVTDQFHDSDEKETNR